MRVVFSVISLLLVVFVVAKLTTKQVQALAPAPGTPAADAGTSPATPAQAAGLQVEQALQQGAAARASEPPP